MMVRVVVFLAIVEVVLGDNLCSRVRRQDIDDVFIAVGFGVQALLG